MWTIDQLAPSTIVTADNKAAEERKSQLALYKAAFDRRLDAVAQERQYDDRGSIVGYYNSATPQWAAEAQAFVAWRDADALPYLFAQLAAVEAGQLQPTLADFVTGIPSINWP